MASWSTKNFSRLNRVFLGYHKLALTTPEGKCGLYPFSMGETKIEGETSLNWPRG